MKPVDESVGAHLAGARARRATGKIVWQREVSAARRRPSGTPKSSQANATPVTDGRHIVAVFGSIGLMVCYDMDGALLWKKDIGVLDSGWFLDAGLPVGPRQLADHLQGDR